MLGGKGENEAWARHTGRKEVVRVYSPNWPSANAIIARSLMGSNCNVCRIHGSVLNGLENGMRQRKGGKPIQSL